MKNCIIASALCAMIASTASAQIAQWDFAGDPGNQASEPASGSASNVAGMAITRGAGLAASSAANAFAASGWETATSGPGSDEYISFGFTVDAGFAVNLNSLYIGTRSSSTGPGQVGLYYSGDGFSSNLFTMNQSGGAFVNSVVDLSALSGLTGAVEFRLYDLASVASTASGTFRLTGYFVDGSFDRNMQFTGEVVAVPAPGALTFAGVAGLVGMRRRRS